MKRIENMSCARNPIVSQVISVAEVEFHH